MGKFTVDEKLNAVRDYVAGNDSKKGVAKRVSIPVCLNKGLSFIRITEKKGCGNGIQTTQPSLNWTY